MGTHYEVLGVPPSATPAQVRRAYYDKARQLHPDGHAGRSDAEAGAVRRAMQDANEAWRVLRDPSSRAVYDRSLRTAPSVRGARAMPSLGSGGRRQPRTASDDDQRGALVRAAPWIAVVLAVVAIVLFTMAVDRSDDDDGLVGRCVRIEDAMAEEVPCAEPNDGRVVGVVAEETPCESGTSTQVVQSGDRFCLRPASDSE